MSRPTTIILQPDSGQPITVFEHESAPVVINETTETDNLVVVNPFGPPGPTGPPGARGPQGPAGDSQFALGEEFTIPTPIDTWIITYNLGWPVYRPSVTLTDLSYKEFEAEVSFNPLYPILTVGPMNSAVAGKVILS